MGSVKTLESSVYILATYDAGEATASGQQSSRSNPNA